MVSWQMEYLTEVPSHFLIYLLQFIALLIYYIYDKKNKGQKYSTQTKKSNTNHLDKKRNINKSVSKACDPFKQYIDECFNLKLNLSQLQQENQNLAQKINDITKENNELHVINQKYKQENYALSQENENLKNRSSLNEANQIQLLNEENNSIKHDYEELLNNYNKLEEDYLKLQNESTSGFE